LVKKKCSLKRPDLCVFAQTKTFPRRVFSPSATLATMCRNTYCRTVSTILATIQYAKTQKAASLKVTWQSRERAMAKTVVLQR